MAESKLCGVCGGPFHQPAILTYPDSPRSAQGFLDSPDQPDEVVNLEIYQCQCCGLVQHDLPPVSYYRDVIRAVAFSNEMGAFRAGQLGEWVKQANLQDKRLLEVGCGKGEYMDLLRQAGAQHVHGLENSQASLEFARKQGLTVERGYLASGFTNPWPERFDSFAIFSFMEHWPDLNGSLRALQGCLNEEAQGLVEVPNFEFIVANGLYSEFTVDHIFYFDRQTLRAVLELNGFEVMAIDPIWHGYILSAQVRKRKPQKPMGFIAKQQRIIEQLQQFAGRFAPVDVVVWGAGHQALAVLSLAKLQSMVSHVVDSAPFKQNKYTPGTRLLIKPPASLLQDQPKAIIIMAAAYSDEVAQTIERAYPMIAHVAILREVQLEVVKGE
jgi:SAM-dependent methyltransferase